MISHEYVVTAAHCFDKVEHGNLHENIINFKCGTKHNKTLQTPVNVIKNRRWDSLDHNVAVIQIQKITYSTVIRPACVMSREELLLDSELIVVGTGSTRKLFRI